MKLIKKNINKCLEILKQNCTCRSFNIFKLQININLAVDHFQRRIWQRLVDILPYETEVISSIFHNISTGEWHLSLSMSVCVCVSSP